MAEQPEPGSAVGEAPRRRRRRVHRGRVVAGGVALAVVLAGAGVAVAANRPEGTGRYRTAVASQGSVIQTVTVTGTLSSVDRVDAAFGVAGTVGTVDVAVGQSVTAGQQLAALDLGSLQDAVDEAQSRLADAQQTLEDDLDAQTTASTATSSTATSSTSGTSSGTGGGTGAPSGGSSALDAAVAAVRQAQTTLLSAHDVAVRALADAHTAVATSHTACAASTDATAEPSTSPSADLTTDPATEPSSDPSSEPSASPTASPTADPTADPSTQPADCSAALDAALTAQDAVAAAQQAVQDAAGALDRAVGDLQEAAAQSAGTSTPATSTPAGTPAATPSTSGASGAGLGSSTRTSTPTAADVLADRAEIESAQADLAIQTDALARSTITSPIAGTVAQVALAAGDDVSASSSTAVITVIGTTGFLVETSVSASQLELLSLGQEASIRVSSTDQVIPATVSSIGVLDESSTAEPSYAVQLAVDATDQPLFNGGSAQVSITVGGGTQTLTVPTSAVHVDGSARTVQVLAAGKVSDVTVTVGAVGAELTEVTSGIADGDVVVLADLDQPLDKGSSSSSTGLSGLSQQTGQGAGSGMPGGFGGSMPGAPPGR